VRVKDWVLWMSLGKLSWVRAWIKDLLRFIIFKSFINGAGVSTAIRSVCWIQRINGRAGDGKR